jgi:hypothetical protein
MKKILICICVSISTHVAAQLYYGVPSIIIDKDGYTNIREEPNGKSKILGQAYKKQLLWACCNEESTISTWISATTLQSERQARLVGYIYKQNLLLLSKLLHLHNELKSDIFRESNPPSKFLLICKNSAIIVAVELKHLTNERSYGGYHLSKEYYNGKEVIGWPSEIDWSFGGAACEFNSITVEYKGKKMVVSQEDLEYYYVDVHSLDVFIGLEGEVYVGFTGGAHASYDSWLVFDEEKLVDEYLVDFPCSYVCD